MNQLLSDSSILVLGAYGLAGRAIVKRLAETTPYAIVAAGRSSDKLQSVLKEMDTGEHVRGLTLDATDTAALREACDRASFVINAVGPFARNGATIARIVVECGRPYLDCANEQTHYRALLELDDAARRQGVPMITAAGAIPGVSTLVVMRLLEQFPQATQVDCCWAQFRHAYANSGLASVMGGILEAVESPAAVSHGALSPVVIGRSSRHFDLPGPFGRKQLLEVPTIDALTLYAWKPLQEFHTWFYMGDLPTWLLEIVRILRPDRRPWAYRFIEALMKQLNARDTQTAIDAGTGPESLLHIRVQDADAAQTESILFHDGAVATACLPAYIADACLKGDITSTGLLTPLDVIDTEVLPDLLNDAVIGLNTQNP